MCDNTSCYTVLLELYQNKYLSAQNCKCHCVILYRSDIFCSKGKMLILISVTDYNQQLEQICTIFSLPVFKVHLELRTNSMEQRPSCKADSRSAGQEIAR